MRIAANNKLLFSQLDLIVSGLLKRACQNQARVLIVTNVHKSWVDYSSQTLLPLTAELLKAQVLVISARAETPATPATQWKIQCFMQLFEQLKLKKDSVTNLVVVGDSMNEMNAGQRLAKSLPHCILKMIKMQETPQPRELLKQLVVINDSWDNICSATRNFNMKLERKQKKGEGDPAEENKNTGGNRSM